MAKTLQSAECARQFYIISFWAALRVPCTLGNNAPPESGIPPTEVVGHPSLVSMVTPAHLRDEIIIPTKKRLTYSGYSRKKLRNRPSPPLATTSIPPPPSQKRDSLTSAAEKQQLARPTNKSPAPASRYRWEHQKQSVHEFPGSWGSLCLVHKGRKLLSKARSSSREERIRVPFFL